MADDRMRNDERNLGGAGQHNKDDFGQQSPGRHKQDDVSTGQRGQGQGQQNQPKDYNVDEDDFGTGKTGGGQRDRNQNR